MLLLRLRRLLLGGRSTVWSSALWRGPDCRRSMRRVGNLLGDRTLIHGRAIHRLTARRKRDPRPIDAIRQHEILASDLAHGNEILSGRNLVVQLGRDGNLRDRDPLILVAGAVMNDPEVRIEGGSVGTPGLSWDKPKTSPRVGSNLCAWSIAAALVVHFDELYAFLLVF